MAGDRAVDEFRVDLLQAVIIQAIAFEAPDLEVFKDDIRLCDQFSDQVLPFGMRDIDRKGLLVSIGGQEVGRAICVAISPLKIRWPPGARVVPGFWAFNFDNLCAEIPKDLPCPGTSQHSGKIQDTQMR